MVKVAKYIWTIAVVMLLFCLGGLIADKETIQENVIRLHVVASTDSAEDQSNKLVVRDSVLSYLKGNIDRNADATAAKEYLLMELDNIEAVANKTLQDLGLEQTATVTLRKEEFPARCYETFSLPSGIYDSLRVTIGDGKGQNWWCVVFPSLCLPNSTSGFKSAAVYSGFDQGLTNTMAEEDGYKIRFFFLDCLGKIENFLSFG